MDPRAPLVPLAACAVAAAVLAHGATALPAPASAPRPLWDGRVVASPAAAPVLSGDTLWVVGTDRRIVSLDARRGDRRWRRTLPAAAVAPPVLAPGPSLVLAVGRPDPMILCLDRRDGRELWTVPLDFAPAGLAVARDLAIVVGSRGRIRALALADGAARWGRDLDRPIAGSALADSAIVVLARADSVWSLAAGDGRTRWGAATSGVHAAPPAAAGGSLVLVSYAGEIAALDLAGGGALARAGAPAPQVAPIAIAPPEAATVAAGGEITSFRFPSFLRGWTTESGETVSAGACAWGSWWIVPCQSGKVLAISRETGAVDWSLTLRSPVSMPPAVDAGRIFLIDDSGRVDAYALEVAG